MQVLRAREKAKLPEERFASLVDGIAGREAEYRRGLCAARDPGAFRAAHCLREGNAAEWLGLELWNVGLNGTLDRDAVGRALDSLLKGIAGYGQGEASVLRLWAARKFPREPVTTVLKLYEIRVNLTVVSEAERPGYLRGALRQAVDIPKKPVRRWPADCIEGKRLEGLRERERFVKPWKTLGTDGLAHEYYALVRLEQFWHERKA